MNIYIYISCIYTFISKLCPLIHLYNHTPLGNGGMASKYYRNVIGYPLAGFVWNRVSSCDSVTSCVITEEVSDFDDFCIFFCLRWFLIGVSFPIKFLHSRFLWTYYDSTWFVVPNSWMIAIQKTSTETWSPNLLWKHDPPNLSWESGSCWTFWTCLGKRQLAFSASLQLDAVTWGEMLPDVGSVFCCCHLLPLFLSQWSVG